MNRAFVASGATHPFSTDDQQTSSFAAPVRPGLLRGLLVMVIRPLADPFYKTLSDSLKTSSTQQI